ncbi:glycogen synthase [Persicirhabdus sediminis]|uniref:starch synthase n=1 Tax=Persicirhabdus sediminis TaxID=454144 RepID=A0A8J7MGS3_9BACT|nr:glycogen/starch synthase [Persicirhabdus sediminis]MBK1792650.1 glycogen/starch synthase [Persicirhabdus sediminis]
MSNPRHVNSRNKRPKILVVTPEITYLPAGMGNMAQRMSAKAGGLADVSASLVSSLYKQGAAVHVGLPNYRSMFNSCDVKVVGGFHEEISKALPEKRIHLAEDRIFYYKKQVYTDHENHLLSLAFQREIINHIIPLVQPDLIHCNDWMTGLIPSVAKKLGIPCLFTIHNIHTEKTTMSAIEDRGIDAAEFWQHLYFEKSPYSYEEARDHNGVDLLASGIFAADHVNSVSPTFLHEVVEGRHGFVPEAIQRELANKMYAGCASGILNAPDVSYDPSTDEYIHKNYSAKNVVTGKRENKAFFQKAIGLDVDPNAPILFWPSRLDPLQKGCQLLADILYQLIADYSDINLQVAIVANGAFQVHFENIVNMHGLHGRVAVVPFSEAMSRQGYASSDFTMMPSRFEPCGLPQMVSPKYGNLAIVHDTGGLHDTVEHMFADGSEGNGFRFQHYSSEGLRWAINEAIGFYRHDSKFKKKVLSRVMNEADERFNHETTAAAYIQRYEQMLGRPVGYSEEMEVVRVNKA